MTIVVASLGSFALSAVALLLWRRIAGPLNLIDRPGGHKTHHGEVPVVGGLAMYVGVAATALIDLRGTDGVAPLLALAGFMVLMGALDDRFNVRPSVRLGAQFAAAVVLVHVIHGGLHHLGNLLGFGSIPLGLLALPFSSVGIVTFINAFNMLDGLDGLAGTTGLVGFLGLTYLASTHHQSVPGALAACAVGAIGAFLIFNLPLPFNRPLRTFMGDAGSTFLGFLFAALAVEVAHVNSDHVPPVVILWLIPLPIIEVFSSTLRRIVRGISPTRGDTGHAHHVLYRSGFSVRTIWLIYVLFSVACAVYGIIADERGVGQPALFIGFLVLMAAWTVFLANAARLAAWLPAPLRRGDEAVT